VESDPQYLLFQLATDCYALDIDCVEWIIHLPALTPMPETPLYVVGTATLRGKVVPVLDLRQRCGLPASASTPATRVVVVQLVGQTLGLIVDDVTSVSGIPAAAVEPVAARVQHMPEPRLVAGVAWHNDRLVFLLDLAQVTSDCTGVLLEGLSAA